MLDPNAQVTTCTCGRRVYRAYGKLRNAAGCWADEIHLCQFDGADVRGDTDDSPTRAVELATRDKVMEIKA